jgi:hypothetical protein
MFSFEIEQLLLKNRITAAQFKYILPINHLHKINKTKQHYYIINSRPSNHSGEHWFYLCVTKNGKSCEIYDPLIDKKSHYFKTVHNYIEQKLKIKRVVVNTKKTQHILNDTCGQHCVFFAYSRAHGINYNRLLHFLYKNSVFFNDFMVKSFVDSLQKHYNKKSLRKF